MFLMYVSIVLNPKLEILGSGLVLSHCIVASAYAKAMA